MARRTITQIQGEFGLPSNSNNNALSDLEKSIADSTGSLLDELRSVGTEQFTGRGMGRSSFANQAIMKQEGDIKSKVATELAGLKFGEYQKDQDMNRNIVLKDVESQLLGELEETKINAAGQAQSRLQLEQLFPTLLLEQIEQASGGNEAPFLLPAIGAITQSPTIRNLPDDDRDALIKEFLAFGTAYGAMNLNDIIGDIGGLFNNDKPDVKKGIDVPDYQNLPVQSA